MTPRRVRCYRDSHIPSTQPQSQCRSFVSHARISLVIFITSFYHRGEFLGFLPFLSKGVCEGDAVFARFAKVQFRCDMTLPHLDPLDVDWERDYPPGFTDLDVTCLANWVVGRFLRSFREIVHLLLVSVLPAEVSREDPVGDIR